MAIYETHDAHKVDVLRTRWYSNNYNQCKDAVISVAKQLGYEVVNVDDNYCEMLLEGAKYSIITKITSITPRETGVDFHVTSRSMLDFGAGKKHITLWYDSLSKHVQYKGTSLHING